MKALQQQQERAEQELRNQAEGMQQQQKELELKNAELLRAKQDSRKAEIDRERLRLKNAELDEQVHLSLVYGLARCSSGDSVNPFQRVYYHCNPMACLVLWFYQLVILSMCSTGALAADGPAGAQAGTSANERGAHEASIISMPEFTLCSRSYE